MACRPLAGKPAEVSAPAQRVHDLHYVAFSQDMLAMAAAAG